MELVDTHCHLQFDAYRSREDEVLAAASQAGVKKLICVGTNLADSAGAIELSHSKQDVWAAVGIHPHEATQFLADPGNTKKLKDLASQPRVVAIGETGLDYYRDISAREDQQAALRVHLRLARGLNLPVIFHVRDAWADFWPVYDELPVPGVVHSFTAGPKQLAQALSRNLYVALNGIMTFTKDESQLEAARAVPADKLLIETDAPFLTPVPERNSLCQPKHLRVTAEFLANLRGEELEDLARQTTTNATKLFNLR